MMWMRFVSGLSMMAWGVACATAALPVSPRVFFLSLVLAASTTIPILTVFVARKHVHAYIAGWLDRDRHAPDPNGGVQADVEPARLRKVA